MTPTAVAPHLAPGPTSSSRPRLARLTHHLLVLGALGLGGGALAACPTRDVNIEQAGVGVIQADALDVQGDVSILTNACFEQGGISFDAAEARVTEGGVTAGAVRLGGAGLAGTANGATSGADGAINLTGLNLDLELPSAALAAVPVPPGRYRLSADTASLAAGGLRFGRADLTGERGERYSLQDATLAGQRLSAASITLGRLQAQNVQAGPGDLRAGSARVNLCRDPNASGLALQAEGVSAGRTGTRLRSAQLLVGGFGLPTLGDVLLPVTAAGDTLGQSAESLLRGTDLLRARFQDGPPVGVLGSGYGLRNFPFFDAYDTRLDAALHNTYLEFGVRSNLNGTLLRAGIFADSDNNPLPEFSLTRQPPAGLTYTLAARGAGNLSDARLGYAWSLGTPAAVRLDARLDAGLGYQYGQVAAFGRGFVGAEAVRVAGPVVFGVRAGLDSSGFGTGFQTTFEALASASYAQGPFRLQLSHFERDTFGRAPLPGFYPEQDRLTTASAAYVRPPPDASGLGLTGVQYTLQYDWLARRISTNAIGASVAIRAGSFGLLPRASYDFAKPAYSVGADALIYSDCFAYGLGLDYMHDQTAAPVDKWIFGLRISLQ